MSELYSEKGKKKQNGAVKKGRFKEGQIVKTTNERLVHNKYKIIQAIDKDGYNMYVAENIKFGWKYDFTDMDKDVVLVEDKEEEKCI